MFFNFVAIPQPQSQDVYTNSNFNSATDLHTYCSVDNVAAGSINGFWIDGGNDPIGKFSGNIVSMLVHSFLFHIPLKISNKSPKYPISFLN